MDTFKSRLPKDISSTYFFYFIIPKPIGKSYMKAFLHIILGKNDIL